MVLSVIKNDITKEQFKTGNFNNHILSTTVVLIIIIIFTIFLRLYTLDIPLERDEGEYAYAGQLILDGYAPYQHIYSMKLPGIYYIYAGVMAVFGETARGIHLGLLLFNIITILCLFYLVAQIINKKAATVAALFYAILSANHSVIGLSANAEHFLVFPALLGILLLLKAMQSHKDWLLFFSGLCLGICFAIKQQGVVYAIFALVYLLVHLYGIRPFLFRFMIRIIAFFSIGLAVPYVLICIIMYLSGTFPAFWFWTVKYAQAYSSLVSLSDGLLFLKQQVVYMFTSSPLIWLMVIIGLLLLIIDNNLRGRRSFIILFVLFSFLAVCPGLYFRQHYFILFLPAAALLAGLSTNFLEGLIRKFASSPIHQNVILFTIICLCALPTLYMQRYIFRMSPFQISHHIYGENPFPESIEISRIIRSYTAQTDSVLILGSEPQILFYSHRRSATGYIYMYPLMEPQDYALKMIKDMIREVEISRPQLLVNVHIEKSWFIRQDSYDEILFNWINKYQKQYKLIGIVDIFKDNTKYYLEPNLSLPKSSNFIALYKKME
jgi:hypothetical protein